MNRREVLAVTGLAGTPLFAGCVSSSDTANTESLAAPAWLSVRNTTGEPVDVAIDASKDGTAVYSTAVSLDGIAARADDDLVDYDGRRIDEPWLGDVGQHTISATIADTDIEDSIATADLVEAEYDGYDAEGTCYYFLVRVGPPEPQEAATADSLTVSYSPVGDSDDVPEGVNCE